MEPPPQASDLWEWLLRQNLHGVSSTQINSTNINKPHYMSGTVLGDMPSEWKGTCGIKWVKTKFRSQTVWLQLPVLTLTSFVALGKLPPLGSVSPSIKRAWQSSLPPMAVVRMTSLLIFMYIKHHVPGIQQVLYALWVYTEVINHPLS